MPDTEVLSPPTDEAVPDEVTPDDEEIVEGDAAVADEAPAVDEQALQEAIDALGPDDPAVKALQAKLAPPSVDDERLEWETEKERQERLGQVSAAQRYYQSYEPQQVYNTAYGMAHEQAQQWAASVQAAAQAIFNGSDGAPDPTKQWVMDADAIAQQIAQIATELVEQAKPAARSWNSARFLDVLTTDWEKSPVHKYLSPDERQQVKEAKRLQYPDHRAVRINQIYSQAAIRGGPQIREEQTKAQRAAEREKEKHRETLAAAIGGRGAVTNGAGGGGRTPDQVLDDPRSTLPQLQQAWKRKFGTAYELR